MVWTGGTFNPPCDPAFGKLTTDSALGARAERVYGEQRDSEPRRKFVPEEGLMLPSAV